MYIWFLRRMWKLAPFTWTIISLHSVLINSSAEQLFRFTSIPPLAVGSFPEALPTAVGIAGAAGGGAAGARGRGGVAAAGFAGATGGGEGFVAVTGGGDIVAPGF